MSGEVGERKQISVNEKKGMIKVKVEFLGSIASELGENELVVDLKSGAKVGDLIEVLSKSLREGGRFKRLILDEQGQKRRYVLLMLNYKLLYKDPLVVEIPDGAKVVFAMPSAGG